MPRSPHSKASFTKFAACSALRSNCSANLTPCHIRRPPTCTSFPADSCARCAMADGRRVLVHPDRVRDLFARTRQRLRQMGERHAAELLHLRMEFATELAALKAELAEVSAEHAQLRAAAVARAKAEAELAGLPRPNSPASTVSAN